MGEFEEAKDSFDGLIKLAKELSEACRNEAKGLKEESEKMWESHTTAVKQVAESGERQQSLLKEIQEKKARQKAAQEEARRHEQQFEEAKSLAREAQTNAIESTGGLGKFLQGLASNLTAGMIPGPSDRETELYNEQAEQHRKAQKESQELLLSSMKEQSELLGQIDGLETDEDYETKFVGPGLALAANALS